MLFVIAGSMTCVQPFELLRRHASWKSLETFFAIRKIARLG